MDDKDTKLNLAGAMIATGVIVLTASAAWQGGKDFYNWTKSKAKVAFDKSKSKSE